MTANNCAFIHAYENNPDAAKTGAARDRQPSLAAAIEPIPSRNDVAASQATTAPIPRPKMVIGRKALHSLAANAALTPPIAARGGPEISSRGDHENEESPGAGVIESVLQIDGEAIVDFSPAPQEPPPPRRYRLDQRPTVVAPRAEPNFHQPAAVHDTQYRDRSAKNDPTKLRPELEVDRFRWPRVCEKLLSHRQDLQLVVEKIEQQSLAGGQLVAIAATQPGDGCTTLLLCLARLLAERNRRVCLVDANCNRPDLAEQLGLSPEAGWETIDTRENSLAATLVESVADGLTVLPLVSAGRTASCLADLQRSGALSKLRATFDVVLIDCGAIENKDLNSANACLLVKREASGSRLTQLACRQLEESKVPLIGLIENRCRP